MSQSTKKRSVSKAFEFECDKTKLIQFLEDYFIDNAKGREIFNYAKKSIDSSVDEKIEFLEPFFRTNNDDEDMRIHFNELKYYKVIETMVDNYYNSYELDEDEEENEENGCFKCRLTGRLETCEHDYEEKVDEDELMEMIHDICDRPSFMQRLIHNLQCK